MTHQAYTPESLGERWGVSPAMVRQLVRAGALKAFRVGRQIRVLPHMVEDYEQRSGAAATATPQEPRRDPPIFRPR